MVLPAFARAREKAHHLAAQQYTQQGWQLLQAGNLSGAQKQFAQAVETDSKNAEAWHGLGWAYFDLGQPQVAQTNFEKALSLDPTETHGVNSRGQLYFSRQNSLDSTQAGALNGLGQVYLSQRNYEQAEKYLLQAAPKETAACFGLARLYLLEGKFDQAAAWAQKVVDAGQADDSARLMLKAAQEKHIGDELRRIIDTPPHGGNATH
jgi:Tfp pilus assembly protein PilF